MSLAFCTLVFSEPVNDGKPSGHAVLLRGRGSGTPFFFNRDDIFFSLALLAVPQGGAACKYITIPDFRRLSTYLYPSSVDKSMLMQG